jgi:hypothetical protein
MYHVPDAASTPQCNAPFLLQQSSHTLQCVFTSNELRVLDPPDHIYGISWRNWGWRWYVICRWEISSDLIKSDQRNLTCVVSIAKLPVTTVDFGITVA